MQFKRGFTIVELLIVIVVIAILAAISIVAYNGIQTRAKNTKTINATSVWIKAIKLFNAEKDSWPTSTSCLGSSTTYQGSGGQCWNNASYVINTTFTNQVLPYLTSEPEPDTTDISSISSPRVGAFYQVSGNNRFIWMTLSGSTTCPTMSIPLNNSGTEAKGIYCIYLLGTV